MVGGLVTGALDKLYHQPSLCIPRASRLPTTGLTVCHKGV
jgi:hypothetical protein